MKNATKHPYPSQDSNPGPRDLKPNALALSHRAKTVASTLFQNYISLNRIYLVFSKFLGFHQIYWTLYHPQSNGMVDRFHRTLRNVLFARANSVHWFDELPIILLGLRAMPKDGLLCSFAELVDGQPLHLPGEYFIKSHNDSEVPYLLLN